MDHKAFLTQFNPGLGVDQNKEGYHVRYPDGYHSWSPKAVFEEAYRLVSNHERDSLK